MSDEAGPGVGLEHAIAERERAGKLPVGLGLRLRDIGVGKIRNGVALGMIEAIHGPIIKVCIPADMAMVYVRALLEGDRLKGDGLTMAHPGLDGVGTRKAVEQVIKGAVLLHYDDNVLDLGGVVWGWWGWWSWVDRRAAVAASGERENRRK